MPRNPEHSIYRSDDCFSACIKVIPASAICLVERTRDIRLPASSVTQVPCFPLCLQASGRRTVGNRSAASSLLIGIKLKLNGCLVIIFESFEIPGFYQECTGNFPHVFW